MTTPAPSETPTPAAGVPGTWALFVLGCVTIGWSVLYLLANTSLSAFDADSGTYQTFETVSSAVHLVLDVVFLVLLLQFARGQAGGPAAGLTQGTAWLVGAGLGFSVLDLVGSVSGMDLLPGGDLGRVVSLLIYGLHIAGAVLFWLAITRCAKGTPSAYSPVFYTLLALSAVGWAIPMLLPFERYLELIQSPFGPVLSYGRVALSLARQVLPLLVLYRLATTFPGSAPAEAVPAAARAGSATLDLVVGGLFFFGGLGVTAVSYAAAEGGGRYVVTTGAIVYGGFRLVRGLLRLASA